MGVVVDGNRDNVIATGNAAFHLWEILKSQPGRVSQVALKLSF